MFGPLGVLAPYMLPAKCLVQSLWPPKAVGILRLELQAAVLDVRLCCIVKQELTVNIKDTIFWSDSKTVLQYIANES